MPLLHSASLNENSSFWLKSRAPALCVAPHCCSIVKRLGAARELEDSRVPLVDVNGLQCAKLNCYLYSECLHRLLFTIKIVVFSSVAHQAKLKCYSYFILVLNSVF